MEQKTHDKPPLSNDWTGNDWTLYNVKPTSKTVAQKTNPARLLDQMGIHYELREYEADPDDLAAETVAAKIGLPPAQVFKTLVARGDRNGVCMADRKSTRLNSSHITISYAV